MCQVFPIVCPGGCIGPWTQMTSCPLPYIIRNGLRLAEKQPSKDRQGVAYNASSTLSASFPGRIKGCAIPTDLTLQIPVNLEIPCTHLQTVVALHGALPVLFCNRRLQYNPLCASQQWHASAWRGYSCAFVPHGGSRRPLEGGGLVLDGSI